MCVIGLIMHVTVNSDNFKQLQTTETSVGIYGVDVDMITSLLSTLDLSNTLQTQLDSFDCSQCDIHSELAVCFKWCEKLTFNLLQ